MLTLLLNSACEWLPAYKDSEGQAVFSTLDLAVADWVTRCFPASTDPMNRKLGLLAASVHRATREGNTCLYVTHKPAFIPEQFAESWPHLETIPSILRSALDHHIDTGATHPLVFEAPDILYLHRFHHAESSIAKRLNRALGICPISPDERMVRLIAHIQSPGQRSAVSAPLKSRTILISGGPGTGKTWTIIRCIATILLGNPSSCIRLAAPTGKAVARLAESIRSGLHDLDVPDSIKERIPRDASTIHRLIRTLDQGRTACFPPEPALRTDWLILDEASMIDLELMSRLLKAIPTDCGLILVGDVHQLASVQPGSVFADIHGAFSHSPCESQCLVELTETFRYASDSPLHKLCEAIRRGDTDALIPLMEDHQTQSGSLHWVFTSPGNNSHLLRFHDWVRRYIVPVSFHNDPNEATTRIRHALCLSAQNAGSTGVLSLNRMIASLLRLHVAQAGNPQLRFYWEPMINTTNMPELNVFNGDLGLRKIHIPHANNSEPVWFPSPLGPMHPLPLSQISGAVQAHAITIHKSQGSEADHVCVFLPPIPSPLLTRELIYTAASRARKTLTLIGDRASILLAAQSPTRRTSHLRNILGRRTG